MNTAAKRLNESVWATIRPSNIHGIGVFAIRRIPKGTKITDVGISNLKDVLPIVMPHTDFNEILPEIQRLILDRIIFEKSDMLVFNNPNADACLRSFMNHSNSNNSDGVYALVDIQKNMEITENYCEMSINAHKLSGDFYKILCPQN